MALDPLDELLRGRSQSPLRRILDRFSPAHPSGTSTPDARARRPWKAFLVAGASVVCVALLAVSFLRPNPVPLEKSLPIAAATPAGTAVLPEVSGQAVPDETAATNPGSEGGGTSARLVVHVAGAVNEPGLVTVPQNARVADAVAAAGGFRPDADIDRLNLASPVSDGVRLYVAAIGQDEVPVPEPLLTGPGGVGADGSAATPEDAPIDINTATAEQLDALPGVGPSTAEAIVSYRESNGKFGSVEELQDVRGIGPAKFEAMAAMVVVSR